MNEAEQQDRNLPILENLGLPVAFTPAGPGVRRSNAFRQLSLVFHMMQGLMRTIGGARPLVMEGPGTLAGQGPFCITVNRTPASLLQMIVQHRAVLIGSANRGETVLANFCRTTGFDHGTRIEGILSFNDTTVLFGEAGGKPAVGHIGYAKNGIKAVQRHHAGLMVARTTGHEGFTHVIPEILSFHHNTGEAHLIQSKLPGTGAEPKTLTDQNFEKSIQLSALFLRQLLDPALSEQVLEKEDLFTSDDKRTLLASLPSQYVSPLTDIIERLDIWTATSRPTSVPVHGDYWLRNILIDEHCEQVTGLIDWEWARPSGLPLTDLLHLVFMSSAMRQGCHIGQLLPQIWQEHTRPAWVHSLIEEHRTTLGLSTQDVYMIGVSLWLRYIWQGHVLTWSGGETWLRNLIDGPMEAVTLALRPSSI